MLFLHVRLGTDCFLSLSMKLPFMAEDCISIMFIFSPMLRPHYSPRLKLTKIWKCSLCSLTSLVVALFIYELLFLEETDDSYREVRWSSVKYIPSSLSEKLSQIGRFSNNLSTSSCPVLSIHTKPLLTQSPTCRLPKVKEDACSFAKSLFATNAAQYVCNSSQIEVCKVEENAKGLPQVECHSTICRSSDLISVGFINPRDGSLSWKHFSFVQDAENAINHYIQHTPRDDYFPFTFLRCDEFWNPKSQTQLFLLPPRSADAGLEYEKLRFKPINVNLILIDSVSRPHFYRSLPQTVKALRSINSDTSIPAMVLDFEFFHSVKHRTFETMHALFSGELVQIDQNMNPFPVGAHTMFGKFKQSGYQTLWQEDMCWTYEWGLVRDLKVMNESLSLEERWKQFNAALKNNSIDFTGITHSSCEVLKSFDVPEFFHEPPNICYSGKHYHTFFLSFLKSFFRGLYPRKKPLFSFTMLDVGHEPSGLRIQTLDSALSNFVTAMAADQNTLTVLLSDHGNTYGFYPRTMEGRLEIYQPHLFMIIPNGVEKLLTKDRLQVLKENQKRLISVVDLHKTLMVLADYKNKNLHTSMGLFQPILINRTCDDLHLLIPTPCICHGWQTKVPMNSFHFIIAEFALGQLNEMIQGQYLQNSKTEKTVSGFGSCERLRGQRFENIREKREDRGVSVALDMYVQNEDVFAVEVLVVHSASVLLEMKFLQYSRFSEYGIYKTCADKEVDLRLCICKDGHHGNILDGKTYGHDSFVGQEYSPKWQFYGDIFSSTTRADNMHENCLFILLREHKSGVIFEVANSCSFVHYSIELDLSLDNMQVSEKTPLVKEVGPGIIHFLIAVIQLDPNINWSWKYTVNFSWRVLH